MRRGSVTGSPRVVDIRGNESALRTDSHLKTNPFQQIHLNVTCEKESAHANAHLFERNFTYWANTMISKQYLSKAQFTS